MAYANLAEAMENISSELRSLMDAGHFRPEEEQTRDEKRLNSLVIVVDQLADVVGALVAGETVPVHDGQPVR